MRAHPAAVKPRRRKPTIAERARRCECCSYPISHVHHVLDFSSWEGHGSTIHVCANCHEAVHLDQAVDRSGMNKNARSVQSFGRLLMGLPTEQRSRLSAFLRTVREQRRAEESVAMATILAAVEERESA